MRLQKNDEKDFNRFKEVIMYLKKIPFEKYDAEYVFQDGKVIFMDFTVPDERILSQFRGSNSSEVER